MDKSLKEGKHTLEAHEIIVANHLKMNNLTQKKIAERIGISVGKVNRLMAKNGPVDQYAAKVAEAAKKA